MRPQLRSRGRSAALALALALATSALLPAMAAAQTLQIDPAGQWRYGASIYGYLPSMSGSTSAPTSGGGIPINVDVDKILDSLQFTLMGTFDAHNGRWGVFTDLIYLNLGASKQNSRNFGIGDFGLPAGTAANLDLDLKGAIWTVAGQYRVVSDPALKVDLLAGARMFRIKQDLSWIIVGDLGPVPPAARFGDSRHSETLWDGVIGVKGRYAFGPGSRWSAPFYVDVGTGESKLTWQVAAGVSYAYPWGELSLMWRYLAYEMKSGRSIQDLDFNGPMLGATFRW
jgi:opacity protein-like surface antigen